MKYFWVILVVLGFGEIRAQDGDGNNQKNFTIYSVFFGAGAYDPALDFWNRTRLPEIASAEKFGWNVKAGGYLDYYLFKNIRTRWGVSWWKDEVTPGNLEAFRSLKISITSFTGGLLYGFRFLNLDSYAGLKGNFFLLQNQYDLLRGTGNLGDIEQGQSYSTDILLGINKIWPFGLLTGLEFNYTLGNYTQQTPTGNEKVSVRGPYIGINLGYQFKN